jgi:two-component system, chemotaxis family, sensor kinase CheA
LSALLAQPQPAMPPATKAAQLTHKAPAPLHAAEETPGPHPVPEKKSPVTGTVRIATDRLDAIFLQAEEMLSAKLLAQQHKQELQAMRTMAASWSKEWANLRTRHSDFYNMAAQQPQWLELLDRNTAFIKRLMDQLNAMAKSTDQDQRMLGHRVDNLLEDMKKALMLPFSALTESFPRMVREFAREAGKEIKLDIRGGEIEADRRILGEIKDPLMHLIRNCIDHGIEKPEHRTDQHKPSYGTITFTFKLRDGNRVEIEIADDGAGIDIDKVKTSVERLGILSTEQLNKLDQQQALELIYQSGVSTSSIITEISGRGLGLAIVQEKIDKLGGRITLDTQPGSGSTFCILLPLMFASYRGIVVRVGEQLFVLPAASAEQTLRVNVTDILTVENRETIHLNGTTLSLLRLGDALSLPCRDAVTSNRLQVVVLAAGRKHIAIVVDEVLYEQEVLVKSLGKQLARVRNVTGATILGSGKAVPVLNVSDLMKSALSVTSATPGALTSKEAQSNLRKSVLVVEDSITTRSLLKGILESAGYLVVTAIDGIDGLTQLRSGEFDIVVSDIEMPRMNGFELTAKIRSDKKFTELPVVLVTALASREDREHGIDVGANAYIVKNSFEQSNLLEVMQRLI